MQRVYEPADLLEAELLLAMLASEGVMAHLSGRRLLGARCGKNDHVHAVSLMVTSPCWRFA